MATDLFGGSEDKFSDFVLSLCGICFYKNAKGDCFYCSAGLGSLLTFI